MKTKMYILQCALLILALPLRGQGTYVYDQQSLMVIEGAAPFRSFYQPVGQSFAPALPSLDFVQFNLFYSGAFEESGATVLVNVRADSITGTILGSSSPVFIPVGFSGITDFLFSTSVSLTPGLTYYLQPVIQSGGNVSSYVTDGSYPGGEEIFQGSPISDRDLWFREGIVVPEPSSASFLILSGILFVTHRHADKKQLAIKLK